MLGVFQLAFSHFAFAVDSNPGTPSSEINVDLVNGIAVRILDEAGQQQIDNINLDLTAIPGGSFVSGKFNVEVSTSNKTGYKLYMDSSYDQSSVMGTTSPDYTTNLVNQTNTSYVIPTLANNVSLAEFQSGSNNSSNKWGYSLDDASFSPIPVHATPDMVDSLSTPTASTLTPVTIGTNVNMDMASGVYKNQLTFSAVAEPVPTDYTLYFESGTTDTVTNLPETMTYSGVATSHTFTIPATAPSRTGYNFTGYLDESTSTTYQAGDSITVVGDIDYTGSATLTAQWELASYTVNITNNNTTSGASSLSVPYGGSKTVTVTPNSGYYLSGVTCPSGYTCSGYSTGTSATGTQTVTVTNNSSTSTTTLAFTGTKLWNAITQMQQMTTAICTAASVGDTKTLTDTRDNNTYTVRKLKDNKCWMTQNLRLTGERTLTPSDSNVSSNWTLPATATSFPTSGCHDFPLHMSSGNTTYGNYYTWNAATAGTGTCAMTSANATSSICPKGWRLPRGNTNGEFQTLYNNYNSLELMQGDPAFVLSGDRNGYSTVGQGSSGAYWSSTVRSSSSAQAYFLSLGGSSGVSPAAELSKRYGLTVRCVAQ